MPLMAVMWLSKKMPYAPWMDVRLSPVGSHANDTRGAMLLLSLGNAYGVDARGRVYAVSGQN